MIDNNTFSIAQFKTELKQGIPNELPPYPAFEEAINHAPKRDISKLTDKDKKLAIRNALRYFQPQHHKTLALEFKEELETYGRIYMHRLRPTYKMKARNINNYPAKTKQAASIMLMIQNNLDKNVAQHPHELITYGGNGSVFQNWAQYHLTMMYLAEMTELQTLVLYSGHPMGLFPSHADAPRLVITNGMMIPLFSTDENWNKLNALGVSQYGQMTAGSFMYIGPQGIVHGTTITVLNAGRMLSKTSHANLAGKLFVTSGLGGMSGAQAKAAVITGCVGVIAEVNKKAIDQRVNDGYVPVENVFDNLNALANRIIEAKKEGIGVAIIYNGNVVDLWEMFIAKNIHVEIGSDQTSLHNPWQGGYYPQGFTFAEAEVMISENPEQFKAEVQKTLRAHTKAINTLCEKGMYFFDYGNAFLKQARDAGADILDAEGEFKYPSYVQDIMGPMCFDYGFGPFRWVCSSCEPADLKKTDEIAAQIIKEMQADENTPDEIQQQLSDNLLWIEQAWNNKLVAGSQARILYADAEGRIKIAKAFNQAIRNGEISAPIILGRDHHDVSGTDSPFRETSNIYDGSNITADMAVHNFVGDGFRGATWISLHNGGGVGWGNVINGGFGLTLDGSDDADRRLEMMLHWDVNNGIARRSWARNPHAISTIKRAMQTNPNLKVTLPNLVDDELL
ncbi:UNVERIFIED_CONTAM: hypothetical protein GTU68_059982 [Idotea baltica]|nr:hypothetical protein [Idotea baltica]